MHKQGIVHEKDFVIYAFCLRKLISRVVILQTHHEMKTFCIYGHMSICYTLGVPLFHTRKHDPT